MIRQTPRRSRWLRPFAAILTTSLAAVGIALSPVDMTSAHADTGSTNNVSVTISPKVAPAGNGTGSQYFLTRNATPQYCPVPASADNPAYIGTTETPTGCTTGPTQYDDEFSMAFNGVASSHQQFTMLVNADGNFQLKSADGPCVDGSAGGTIGDADCSNAGTWNLQPASDGSQYYLLRHVGNDNQCIVPAYSGQLELGTCDPTNDQQLYSITTSNGASLPAPSNSDAIGLGSNQITVCNHGAYVAYADITTNVEEDPSSTTTTAANAGNSNIDAGQCWTDTIPAGKVTSTVTLQRAGVEGAPDGTGNIAVWIVGGVHTDATYDLYGTTCGTSSTFSQASDSQSYSLQASGQVNCNAGSDTVFDDVGAGAQGAWDLVNKILYWVLQASWVK